MFLQPWVHNRLCTSRSHETQLLNSHARLHAWRMHTSQDTTQTRSEAGKVGLAIPWQRMYGSEPHAATVYKSSALGYPSN